MPVLTANISTKKIVLPESSKEGDEAWVEIAKNVLMDHFYNVDLTAGQAVITTQILARAIKNWNFTDEAGNKCPITEDTVKLIPMVDIAHISEVSGLEEQFQRLTKQKKRQSSATS